MRLLKDLKKARERLNQTSRNSSRPPGSDAPWAKIGGDSESDGDNDDNAQGGANTDVSEACGDAEEDGAEPSEANSSSDDTSSKADTNTVKRNPGNSLVPPVSNGNGGYRLPVNADEDHRPQRCVCCGKVLTEETPDSRAYTHFSGRRNEYLFSY